MRCLKKLLGKTACAIESAASQAIRERRLDPYTAVDEIMKDLP
jgi:hypothetical protein